MDKKVLQKIEAYLESWLPFRYERDDLPGFTVAVAHKGKVVFSRSYGYADLEHKTALTPDHIFRIASHSKTFTATAILQLQEKGKLRIDDYAVDYLPWLREHSDERMAKVTIRQLLTHSAGLIRDGLDADYWQLLRPFPDEAQLRQEVLAAALVLENNTKMKYSNFGYSLLGLLIEAVAGVSYHEYVTQHIIRPLRLKATGPEYTDAIKDRIVTGYTRQETGKKRLPIAQIDTRAMASATGFYSTAEDLCTYFSAHIAGSGKLLDDESKKEMQRTQWRVSETTEDEEYGLGLDIDYIKNRRVFGHGGGFPGHISKTFCDPENELVVTVLTNAIEASATWMAKGVLKSIYFFMDNTTEPEHDLERFSGRFIDLWSQIDIVVAGNRIIHDYPDSWDGIGEPEDLEYVDGKTLKITKTYGFYSPGELIHFDFDDAGAVRTIRYAGTTMWPEVVWHERIAGLRRIG